MFRIVRLSGKYYGYEFSDIESEAEDIMDFVNSGDIVILCDDVENFADEYGIDINDITIVSSEEMREL